MSLLIRLGAKYTERNPPAAAEGILQLYDELPTIKP